MKIEPLPWLPKASDAELEALIVHLLRLSLGNWIDDRSRIGATVKLVSDLDLTGARRNSGLALSIHPDDLVMLAFTACAARAESANPLDRLLLKRVGEEMVADMFDVFGAVVSETANVFSNEPAGWCNNDIVYKFQANLIGGDWPVSIGLDETAAVCIRKSAAVPADKPDPIPLFVALANEEASLGCHLGRAQLTAADITALTAGDVIVLDRAVSEPVPLAVEGNVARRGQARISGDEGEVRITLTEELDLLPVS